MTASILRAGFSLLHAVTVNDTGERRGVTCRGPRLPGRPRRAYAPTLTAVSDSSARPSGVPSGRGTTDAAPTFVGSPASRWSRRSIRDSSDCPAPDLLRETVTLPSGDASLPSPSPAQPMRGEGPAHRALRRASGSSKDGHRRPFACHDWPSRGVWTA